MSITEVASVEPDPDLEADPDVERAALEIVVPVLNEERVLDSSIRRLRQFLDDELPISAAVVIADNGSSDGTWLVAQRLSAELGGVRSIRTARQGRGHALRTAWTGSGAAVVGYMDVDLSTDLTALPPLVAPLLSGRADVAIGSRLAGGARVTRSLKREVISRSYNLIVRAALGARISDAQCGFKALRTEVAEFLVPMVEDDSWFFDTELLVQAERHGLRIHEVPVNWVEDPDSRVRIVRTAWDDLKGIRRLRRPRPAPAPARLRPAARQAALSSLGDPR